MTMQLKNGDKCPRCGSWSGTGGRLQLHQGNPGTRLAGRLFLACNRKTRDGAFCFVSYDHPYAIQNGRVVLSQGFQNRSLVQ